MRAKTRTGANAPSGSTTNADETPGELNESRGPGAQRSSTFTGGSGEVAEMVLDAFLARVAEDPQAPALLSLGGRDSDETNAPLRAWTRRELEQRARAVASGLLRLVPEPGARCVILSEARPEWVICDLACAMAGLISVPMFPNVEPGMLARVLDATGTRIAIVENPWQARKLMDAVARRRAPGGEDTGQLHLPEIILMDEVLVLASGAISTLEEVGRGRVRSLHDVTQDAKVAEVARARSARERDLDTAARLEADPRRRGPEREPETAADPEACVTLCYTPGTEGAEKGVIWTHATMTASAKSLGPVLTALEARVPRQRRRPKASALFLGVPLAQALGRAVMWACLSQGRAVALPRSDATAIDDVARLEPTVVVAVPSFYEKIRQRSLVEVKARGALAALVAGWADRTPTKRRAGMARLMDGVADRLMRPALVKRFGADAGLFVSGGAPLKEGVAAFYLRCGLPIRESYGLVETTAITHIDLGDEPTAGTVGTPLPGVEQRIAPDGELFLRGPQMSPGYWRDVAATRKVFDDGWFATGDLAKMAPAGQGRLVITGRKREIIVLSNGRTLAPSPIELRLMEDELVSQAFVHGEQRDFVTVLLSLAEVPLRALIERHEMNPEAFDPVVSSRHPKVHRHLEALVDEVNGFLPPHARIKKFAVLTAELAPGDGLSPTGTLRRNIAAERHRALLDSFYVESF